MIDFRLSVSVTLPVSKADWLYVHVTLLPPANVVCEGYVFTGVCHSFCSQGRGVCVVLFRGCMVLFRGGMCGFIRGGHAWFYSGGVCMVLFGGHALFYLGGVCGFIWGVHGFIQGVCMVLFRGVHGFIQGGHACFFQFFRIQ